MSIAIISSLKDKASSNIKENLINNFNFDKTGEQFSNNEIFQCIIGNKKIKLYTINSELIYADNVDKSINADLFIFISRHQAKEERKCLTLHAPGNFGKAEHGGKEKTLCTAPAFFLKNMFIELNRNAENTGYEASLEATHHGPFLEKPALFAEIGSSEKEWEDRNAGKIIAKSIIGTIKNDSNMVNNKNNNESINKNFNEESKIIIDNNKNNNSDNNENSIKNDYEKNNSNLINGNNNYESVFIIGGSHYSHVANKAMLETNFAIGHVCAKYNLENLNLGLVKEAMEKTAPKAKFVLLDWKGLGKEKKRILDILDKNKIGYKRSDKVS